METICELNNSNERGYKKAVVTGSLRVFVCLFVYWVKCTATLFNFAAGS